MKIVFMGTPDFAVPSLQSLLESKHEVVGVVTATDKLGGRGGKQLLQSEIKKFATDNNLKILQPERLKSKEFLSQLEALDADIFIVVAFRMLPEIVWNMPRFGTYNIHGSLLPKYRGAAPINWAIINGEKETGVSFFKLKHDIDTGNVLLQSKMKIEDDDDFGSVYNKMKYLGAKTLIEGLSMIEKGIFNFVSQDELLVCHAPKIFHDDCLIDFNKTPIEIHNFIRGLSPLPTAHFDFYGEEMKVYISKPEIADHSYKVGEIIIENHKILKIACINGYIHILDLKQEGKRRMNVTDFLNGYKPKV